MVSMKLDLTKAVVTKEPEDDVSGIIESTDVRGEICLLSVLDLDCSGVFVNT